MLLTIVPASVSGIDINAAMSKSTVSVDKKQRSERTTVVQDVTFSTASGNATLTPNRYTMVFSVTEGHGHMIAQQHIHPNE